MAIPGATPHTMPVVEPTVAIVVGTMLQSPPVAGLYTGPHAPTHRLVVPVIGPGDEFTVTDFVAVHPVGNV